MQAPYSDSDTQYLTHKPMDWGNCCLQVDCLCKLMKLRMMQLFLELYKPSAHTQSCHVASQTYATAIFLT